MTQTVEFMLGSANFSPACCRCNAASFTMTQHTDKVVTSMLGHRVTYDEISLSIPLCRKCQHRSWLWFGAAGLAFIGTFAASFLGEAGEGLLGLLGTMGIICAVMGARTRPVKILSYNKHKHSIRLQLHSDAYVDRLVSENPGSVLPPPALNFPRKLLRFFLRKSVILVLLAVAVYAFVAMVTPTARPSAAPPALPPQPAAT